MNFMGLPRIQPDRKYSSMSGGSGAEAHQIKAGRPDHNIDKFRPGNRVSASHSQQAAERGHRKSRSRHM
jgi:hypothetical protein